MDEDLIEKPICKILYRQSSLETRLSPVNLAEENDSEDENNCENRNPKIVQVVPKLAPVIIDKKDIETESNVKKIGAQLENIIIDSVVKNTVNKDVTKSSKPKPKIEPRTSSLKGKLESATNSKIKSTPINKYELVKNPEKQPQNDAINNIEETKNSDDILKIVANESEIMRNKSDFKIEDNGPSVGILKGNDK